MDAVGEEDEAATEGTTISVFCAQPPRAVRQAEEGVSSCSPAVSQSLAGDDDATAAVFPAAGPAEPVDTWPSPRQDQHQRKGSLITTDLDEPPVEPDYINLPAPRDHCRVKGPANAKVFISSYALEENIYEEINELQRRLAMQSNLPVAMATAHAPLHCQHQHQHSTLSSLSQQGDRENPNSLVDEVMDEVARVQLRHDRHLNELNLDLENFLKPQTPEPPPTPGQLTSRPDLMETLSTPAEPSGADGNVDKATVSFFTPPTGRMSRPKFQSHNRSSSTVSSSVSQMMGGERPPLPRSESLDLLSDGAQRRSSVLSRDSTSTSSSNRSESRQSIRNLQHGLQQGIQWANKGMAEKWEKCGLLLAKRTKKVISFVNKDRRSTCEADPLPVGEEGGTHVITSTPVTSAPTCPVANGCDVVDCEAQIYEDIDRSSIGSDSTMAPETSFDAGNNAVVNAADSGFSSSRNRKHQAANGSDSSCCSGDFEQFSSDGDDHDVSRPSSLRALLSGKSIRNKFRGSRNSREEEKGTGGMEATALPTTPVAAPTGNWLTSPPSVERRFSRLLTSLRRSSAGLASPTSNETSSACAANGSVSPVPPNGSPNTSATRPVPLPQLLEEEEIMAGLGLNSTSSTLGTLLQRRYLLPALPPIPAHLTAEQLKRRYIVATIIHSENSYVASLQRLVNEYKKPLEESHPPILGTNKIATLFHRVPEILQCHTYFRRALAECARSWDKEEKIGDVFVANFSKAMVLDNYSDFINNFSLAVDVAKQESKRKSALADFLKVKQISSHDRLSFFGLLVKPVQRFPQFILLLQDLLKHTPQGHVDRMSLQLALTQLESLAELLNERKRESEQYQAFRDTLRRVSGKFSLRPLNDNNRYLLRQDNAHLVELNPNGTIAKNKDRRLLLLNDLLVCVSVASKSGDDYRSSSERLSLKWAFPVVDVEVDDTSTSPTLSRLLSSGSTLRSSEAISGVDSLCQEMNQLMHDYDVITRTGSLISSLHGKYEGLNQNAVKTALVRIQEQLRQKDEEMAWIDSCCLQLAIRNRSGREEKFIFQMESPDIRKDWVIELRLAQLALDPKNSPSWDVPAQERRPSTKVPLFVKSLPVYRSNHETEVHCGCFYACLVKKTGSSMRYLGPRYQTFLWIVSSDGISSHVTLLTSHQPVGPSLKEASTFSLVEVKVTSVEFSPGCQLSFDSEDSQPSDKVRGDLVWLGTESRRILLYSAQEPEKMGQIASLSLPSSVIQLRYHCDQMFVALANGVIAIFKRSETEAWELNAPAALVSLGNDPVVSLLPIGSALYAACGRSVFVVDGATGETLRSFAVLSDQRDGGSILAMAHSGIGLWISLRSSSIVSLYHTETFRHLQNIDVTSNVNRLTRTSTVAHVTALMASKGLLWVGTNVGIALSIPLPRLEGVPIISGRANVSHHAHYGPITFFLTLQMRPNTSRGLAAPAALPPPMAPSPLPSGAIQEESENDCKSPTTKTAPAKVRPERPSTLESPLMLRRRSKESSPMSKRMSQTLPRAHVSSLTAAECDIFGLYGELMNVKDYEEADSVGNSGPGVVTGAMYETLRRSDPDLAAIPAKVSTLDRRLHMKAARPRSLDLSNWSVDSRSSLYTTSSGSEDNASHTLTPSAAMSGVASNGGQSSTLKRCATQRPSDGVGKPSGMDAPRTVLTLSGGRGYIYPHTRTQSDSNERKNSASSPANTNDAHIILWEMKL